MSSILDGLFAPDDTSLPASYGNEALIRRQAQLRDREATLKEAAKAAREAAPPQGTMVSGYYVKPSMAQQLTPSRSRSRRRSRRRGWRPTRPAMTPWSRAQSSSTWPSVHRMVPLLKRSSRGPRRVPRFRRCAR